MTATAPRILTLSLPMPSNDLGPNGRLSWQELKRQKDAYAGACRLTIIATFPGMAAPYLPQARLSLTFVYCTGARIRDWDNALGCFKAGQDQLVRAGLLVSDSPRCLSYGAITWQHCPKRCACGGRVDVTIEEV